MHNKTDLKLSTLNAYYDPKGNRLSILVLVICSSNTVSHYVDKA